jgi:hypothetical protein
MPRQCAARKLQRRTSSQDFLNEDPVPKAEEEEADLIAPQATILLVSLESHSKLSRKRRVKQRVASVRRVASLESHIVVADGLGSDK